MGKITEKVFIRNFNDAANASMGIIKESEIRSVEINALVDTGAAYLCLPPKIIKDLGLMFAQSVPVKTGNGSIELRIFYGAEIIIKDRPVQMQVMENKDDNVPALIGYLVLEAMDWIVDPKSKRIIGNPENNGKWMVDMY